MTTTRKTADHAELARLRQHIANLKLRPGHHVQFGTPSVSQISNYWNRDLADDLEALLSEIAALRGERDRWHSAYEIAHDQATANGSAARQAERQRDELRKALELAAKRFETLRDLTDHVPHRIACSTWADEARQANQGADQ